MHNIVYLVMMVGLAKVELIRLEDALEVSILKTQDEITPGCALYSYSIRYTGQKGSPGSIVLWRHSDLNDFASVVREREDASRLVARSRATLAGHPRFDFALSRFTDTECRTYKLFLDTQVDGHMLVDKMALASDSILVEFLIDAKAYESPPSGALLILCQETIPTGFSAFTPVYRVQKRVSLPPRS